MIIIDSKILIIAAAFVLLIFLFTRYRRKVFTPLVLALIIATLWSAYFHYEYDGSNVFILKRINVYPLTLWAIGLTTLQFITHELPKRYHLALAVIFYFIFLLAAEAVGYYLLDIRLNSHYTSLLNLGIIHAPISMKTFYMLAGPIYLIVLDWFNRKTESTST
jgi:hypothetical protein